MFNCIILEVKIDMIKLKEKAVQEMANTRFRLTVKQEEGV